MSLLLFYFDAARLEKPLEIEAVRRIVESRLTTWDDRVVAALVEAMGERAGRQLFRRYEESFSGLYREATQPGGGGGGRAVLRAAGRPPRGARPSRGARRRRR